MPNLLRLAAVLLFSASLQGQYGNMIMTTAPGVPSGGCAFIRFYINSTNGNVYSCKLGAWQLLGPVGTVTLAQLPFGTANQILGTNAGATAQEHKSLAVGTTGTDFAIAHAANLVTFNLPDASATARGAVTTGAQTFAGTKTFTESGAVTTASYGEKIANTATSSTASINKHGLHISSTGTWNGASANNYGLYVDVPTGGTTNYGAFFGGNVGIGTATPRDALNVIGNIHLGTDSGANAFIALGDMGNPIGSGTSVGLWRSDAAGTGAGVNLNLAGYDGINFRILSGGSMAAPTASSMVINSSGNVVIANLAGTGSRLVQADANGLLSAVAKAVVDLTAQGAAIGATTLYAVPASGVGMYRISYVAKITTIDSVASVLGGTNGFQVIYTDSTDSVVVTTAAGPTVSLNTTQAQVNGSIIVFAKASTNIQYSFGYTATTGDMRYNLHVKVEAQ